ncbi:MAG: hypothetical protein JW843_00740 [Candidatus Aminicenantes bacterium]|nr:hypothetical protein [Candidatus Aminicenantes bacterium]
MNHRDAGRLRRALPILLPAALILGPACRPKIPDRPLFIHFIDHLTENKVVESPFSTGGADGKQAVFPAGSFLLDE